MKYALAAVLVVFLFAGCTNLHPEHPILGSEIKARIVPPLYADIPEAGQGRMFTGQREAVNKAVDEILAISPAAAFSKEKPVTVAIAEVDEQGVRTIRQEDKDAWRKQLEETGMVKVVFISSVILSANPSFHEIRMAGARLRADMIFLYAVVDSVESKYNLGAFLYLSLVGIFFVPGDEAAVLSFAKGVCFDVKNEYLEFAAEGENDARTISPMYFYDGEQLKIDSHKAALENLRSETVLAIKAKAVSK